MILHHHPPLPSGPAVVAEPVDMGFNFRRNYNYVTDQSYAVPICSVNNPDPAHNEAPYPSTLTNADGDSITCGYVGATLPLFVDRNATVDARLAGMNYRSSQPTSLFRIDLPPATYDVTLAGGDYGGGGHNLFIEWWDGPAGTRGTSPLGNLDDTGGSPGGSFWDAQYVLRANSTDWINNNQTRQLTISAGYLTVSLGLATGEVGNGAWAHLRVVTV